jgi:Tfp pilus assembly protein PilN
MFYVALVLALALACVAGVQYFYLLFLEGRIRQQSRRISELEREVDALTAELRDGQESLSQEEESEGESWPELIDEGRDYSMS